MEDEDMRHETTPIPKKTNPHPSSPFHPPTFPFPLHIPFPRKRESLPAPAGNFREAETPTSPIGECGYRRRDSRLRPPTFPFSLHIPFPRKRESLPALAGNSAKRKCNVACGDAWRTMPPREIPAFAGMEDGAGMKDGERARFLRFAKNPPIPPQKNFFQKSKKI